MIWLVILGAILAIALTIWLLSSVIGFVIGIGLMLVLGGVIGAAMGSLLNYKRGILFSVGAGLVGAVVGTVIANILNMPGFLGFELFNLPVLWTALGSALGSALVVGVAKVVAPNEDRKRLGSGTSGLLP
jgi:uncharacterized membrane protein YeaQ/YmgE (transglycosylase-associated protein family)